MAGGTRGSGEGEGWAVRVGRAGRHRRVSRAAGPWPGPAVCSDYARVQVGVHTAVQSESASESISESLSLRPSGSGPIIPSHESLSDGPVRPETTARHKIMAHTLTRRPARPRDSVHPARALQRTRAMIPVAARTAGPGEVMFRGRGPAASELLTRARRRAWRGQAFGHCAPRAPA